MLICCAYTTCSAALFLDVCHFPVLAIHPSFLLPSSHAVLSQSSSDLTVTVIAQSQWHFVGEELYLLATSSHPDLDIVAWEHEETVLQSSVHHVISTLAGGERSTLRIPSLSPGDGGTYTIVARDTGGNEHRKASQDLQLLCE